MSDREAAYKAYQERQKSKNPSTFDTMGAFNKYYNDPQNITSLAVPLDFGKAIPAKERSALLEQFDATSRTAPKAVVPQSLQPTIAGSGFWTKLFAGMERAYNLSAQAASFALTLPEPTNPLYQDANVLKNLRESWQSARQISPGQAFQTNVTGGILGAPVSLAENAPVANKFIDENALFLSSEFDIFNTEQRQKAFREQTVGRWSSFATDVVARFTIDPTIIGGKFLKAVRAARLAVKPGELKAVLSGEQTGARAERIKATLQNFVEGTDNMNESDLFRIDAIRKSANPASMADIIATANKIEDITTRHRVKTGIVQWAMGDAKGAEDLLNTSKEVAAKIGNLESEIFEAKYFGAGIDKTTGQLTMDLLNSGTNLEKNEVLLAQYEDVMKVIYKKLNTEGVLDPRKLPEINFTSVFRQEFSRSQDFIDVRAGAASIPVRVMTGFFYKRPKGWIDFTDNQSVQTIDNMLSQVRNVSEVQIAAYNKILDNLRSKLEVISNEPALVKSTKNQIKEVEDRIKNATFTVERKNELFSRYTSAIDPSERANAYMQIEEELFTTIGNQFGFNADQIRKAWGTYATARARAHNLIRTRLYTAAKDPATGGPAGGMVKGVIGDDGVPMIFPAPINESQLVKQLPTLDIPMMYSVLNKATRAQRFEYFGEKYRLPMSKASKVVGDALDTTAQVRAVGNEMVDSLDALLKFQVLARLGYPQRNVGEGNIRIIFILGPMAVMSRAAGLLKSGYKNILENRFVGATNEDIFEWSNKTKLLAKKDELEASLYYVDDPDLVNRQIAEIDAMLSGKKPIKDVFGMGLNKIKVGDQVITYEDALGATPAQAKYINERFIANAARVVDDHFSELGKSTRNVMESNGDWTIVRGTDEGWLDAYLRVVNRQMRSSSLTRIFMQNKPREVIAKEAREFLYKDPKGRVIRKNLLAGGGRTIDDIINANMLNVDQVFPSYINPEIKEIALSRALTKDDIAKFYGTDPSIRPDVNGAQISNANGTSAAFTLLAKSIDKFYDVFGEIPERGLVRNTMFIGLYRKRMKAEVENAIANYPGEEIPDWYLRKMESNARQWARAEMRRSLYDTSERVESARYLRYGFPFFGAFADIVEKWGRILFDDPTVLRKLDIVYNSPDRAGMTEERNGITYINIPGSWAKRMGMGDRPRAIPKPSLNLIFQGGEWWNPGAGWFVQFVASKLIKRTPELERNAIVKQILPYGATGTGWKDLFIQSPAARQAMNIFNEDNPTRQNLTVLIMAEENAKFDQGLRDTKPTITEINNRVKNQLGIEVAARLILPFASGSRSPYQFYIDAYQALREQNPLTANEEFYKQFGDSFYLFTTSLSKNVTGIAATVEADKVAAQFKDLIAKNPDYGWFIVGQANAGEFSPTVYRKQFETPVAPGSTVTYRTTQDAYEAIASTKAEAGWIKYNKGMDIIEAIRIQRGLPSLSSRGAEDLRIAKQALVSALEQENPDWASVRGKIDLNKVTNFLRFAKEAINDPRLTNRQDMKTMASYLQGREIIRKELATRPNKSIDAQSNADLKVAWDAVIGALIDQDVTFNRIYTRILENDDLTKGL